MIWRGLCSTTGGLLGTMGSINEYGVWFCLDAGHSLGMYVSKTSWYRCLCAMSLLLILGRMMSAIIFATLPEAHAGSTSVDEYSSHSVMKFFKKRFSSISFVRQGVC